MSSSRLRIISGSSGLDLAEMHGEGGGRSGIEGETWARGTGAGGTSALFMSLLLRQGRVRPAESNELLVLITIFREKRRF